MEDQNRLCKKPPAGWWCSRAQNHEGPCAARPSGPLARKPIYFAHRLRGATRHETEGNRVKAGRLVAAIVSQQEALGLPIAPVCAWIHLAEHWSEEDGRALGLVIDCALIDLVRLGNGELWLIGSDPNTSEGMQIEIDHARKIGLPVRDFRYRGPVLP